MIIQFPKRKRHGRASAGSRAASVTNISAVKFACRAVDVASTAPHHSWGMRSRRRHLKSCDEVQPMSDTAAAGEAHRSITALNEVSFCIDSFLGQIGLNSKANVADDLVPTIGDIPAMSDRMSETEEKFAFIRRVKQAREARFPKQNPICTILGIEQGVYKHYEKRSVLPYRFIPKFVAATGIDYEWLLTGVGKGPAMQELPKEAPKRTPRRTKQKVA